MLALEVEEASSGTYARRDAPDVHRRFTMEVTLTARLLHRPIQLSGTITADGIAHNALAVGVVHLVWSRRLMRYELIFSGDDGAAYRFVGERDLSSRGAAKDMPGVIVDSRDEEIGLVTASFDARADLFSTLSSLRLRRT